MVHFSLVRAAEGLLLLTNHRDETLPQWDTKLTRLRVVPCSERSQTEFHATSGNCRTRPLCELRWGERDDDTVQHASGDASRFDTSCCCAAYGTWWCYTPCRLPVLRGGGPFGGRKGGGERGDRERCFAFRLPSRKIGTDGRGPPTKTSLALSVHNPKPANFPKSK